MDISVIIPAFNRKHTLERAIRSVLAQKNMHKGQSSIIELGAPADRLRPGTAQAPADGRCPSRTETAIELIIADDGSTDGTEAWVRQEFPSVVYLHWQEQRGPSYARNRGVEAAQGRWIAFLDSDDEWKPGKLRAQWDFFQAHREYRIGQTEEIWIRNGVRVNPMKKHKKYGGFIFEKCLPLCVISPSAVMMEKSFFIETGGFDESLPACEDYDLWLRIAARHPVGLIEKPYVIKYGGHADQRSREFPAMDRFRIYALEKILSSGALDATQTLAARQMLEEKSRIFRQGAQNQGQVLATPWPTRR